MHSHWTQLENWSDIYNYNLKTLDNHQHSTVIPEKRESIPYSEESEG